MGDEKKRTAESLNGIIAHHVVFRDENQLSAYLAALKATSKKIKGDEGGFKTLMKDSAEPHIQILDSLISLYESQEINLEQKSDINAIVLQAMRYACQYAKHPGIACSLEYISEVAKLGISKYNDEINSEILKLSVALNDRCTACPYQNIEGL